MNFCDDCGNQEGALHLSDCKYQGYVVMPGFEVVWEAPEGEAIVGMAYNAGMIYIATPSKVYRVKT